MPELPEVETVVRDLRPLLTGRAITGVRQSAHKLRRPWDAAWNAAVGGATVTGVRRRGKWILADLTPPTPLPCEGRGEPNKAPPPAGEGLGRGQDHPVLIVHLGMTGQFTVVKADAAEPDHLHVVFELDNRTELRLRDQRRFGSATFSPSAADTARDLDAALGPEPFDLDPQTFRTAVTGTARNLKAVLLDQTVVAGVGNIYADEALFRAKLHPARTGKSLTAAECAALCAAIEAVLTRAIESRGSTIRDYVGGSGLKGGFQNEFAVYGRTGEACRACGAAVECARLAGRASHFCPACQKPSPPQRHKGRATTREGK